ncbi:MAG: hypothetical protein K2J74_05150 [Muribaculaceae bacterium]|nr:hypothetical protein [Muribaculaceae bacterium]
MKSTDLILEQIRSIGEGVVFGYSDLNLPADLQGAGAMALSRMVTDKQLKKVGKGKFYKPIVSRLGEMPPMIEQLTKDLLFKDGRRIGYITGVPAFAQLGLTTQISSKILIAGLAYKRPLKRAGYDISYTKQLNVINDESIPLLRILDALKFIKKIPATTTNQVVEVLKAKIMSLTEIELKCLISYVESYPASVKALLGAILDAIGYDGGDLKRTLSPFTKYNLNISTSVLPTKLNWNIK